MIVATESVDVPAEERPMRMFVAAPRAEGRYPGVVFYSDVNVVDEGPLAGWRWCYFSDPDGLALELVEIEYYLKDEREAAAAEYIRTRPAKADLESQLGA